MYLSLPRIICAVSFAARETVSKIINQGSKERRKQVTLHSFSGPFSGTTQVSQYQKGKTIWILLKQETVSGTSLQTDNHASTPPLSFLQAGCPSCRPTNSVKTLKEARK